METTDIGLIVPSGTMIQKRSTIIRDHAKIIQRAMGVCLQEGMQLLFICPLCEKAGRQPMIVPDVEPMTNELLFRCPCTERRLENTLLQVSGPQRDQRF